MKIGTSTVSIELHKGAIFDRLKIKQFVDCALLFHHSKFNFLTVVKGKILYTLNNLLFEAVRHR
jgi:hypothetical protein